MTDNQIADMIANAITHIAPEMEFDEIDRDEDLREECDLDSMDFLNLITALKKSTGVSIPETDYAQVRSYNQLQEYIQQHHQPPET
ncbi:acyl carrier protein [Vibrio ponticus]|uniref:Acyl carrier protein n=1 Tax=Vibrio ponticus TaxID=265668 RepID=A0A3N3DUB2_9VIBR|nr:acyl carrier protein [Vibrio ponticus]ROV58050.1 acyl carrier protein [Vibrio ponticus]